MAPLRITRSGRNATLAAIVVLIGFVYIGVQVSRESPERAQRKTSRWTSAIEEDRLASQPCAPTEAGSISASVNSHEGLAKGLRELADGLKYWRQRLAQNHSEPEASIVAQVARFKQDSAVHARLASSRFALDQQMAALQATRSGPGARLPTPLMPPLQEADLGFPEPSTFTCRMLPDGFEVCLVARGS
jgi:hypothetical protein